MVASYTSGNRAMNCNELQHPLRRGETHEPDLLRPTYRSACPLEFRKIDGVLKGASNAPCKIRRGDVLLFKRRTGTKVTGAVTQLR
jgi:hypothetical protein